MGSGEARHRSGRREAGGRVRYTYVCVSLNEVNQFLDGLDRDWRIHTFNVHGQVADILLSKVSL